jgi:hypothetical protein
MPTFFWLQYGMMIFKVGMVTWSVSISYKINLPVFSLRRGKAASASHRLMLLAIYNDAVFLQLTPITYHNASNDRQFKSEHVCGGRIIGQF